MNNKDYRFIKIKKEDGQRFIKLMNKTFTKQSIIDHKIKVIHDNNYILFPIIENENLIEILINTIKIHIDFHFETKIGLINHKYKHKSIKEALKNEIAEKFFKNIPNSYDIIGEIAIIEFDKFKSENDKNLEMLKQKVAKCIIEVNNNVKSVYEKRSEIKGEYRLRNLEFLYGENITETIHKENNCFFKLDVKKTFFTPRLVYERNRIASDNFKDKEVIVDLFSGVGPFAIQIAKKNNAIIHAFDINPDAYKYLKENIDLNKLNEKVLPYNIDIKDLTNPNNRIRKRLSNKVDRIIMNLPERSIKFIDIACFLMKKNGGILHFYQFSEKPNPIKKALKKITKQLKIFNWQVQKVLNSKIVKAYSPKSDLVVIDLQIKSKK